MADQHWVPSAGASGSPPPRAPGSAWWGRAVRSRGRGMSREVGEPLRREVCLVRSRALPRGPLRARGGWEARGWQDAPGPGSARVRVCARWGGAGRVHRTGWTRVGAGAGRGCTEGWRRGAKTPREPGPRRRRARAERKGRTLRPAAQRASTELQRPRTGKEVARASVHRGRSASPETCTRPGRGSARTRRSHPGALPAQSAEPQRERVLRGKDGAWPARDEPMGRGGARGGGARMQSADWPARPPVCRCGGVTWQGPGRLPVGGQRGAGKGARAPRLAGAGGGGFLSVRATRWPRWQLRTSARRPREPQPPPPAPPPRSPERRPGRPRRA